MTESLVVLWLTVWQYDWLCWLVNTHMIDSGGFVNAHMSDFGGFMIVGVCILIQWKVKGKYILGYAAFDGMSWESFYQGF